MYFYSNLQTFDLMLISLGGLLSLAGTIMYLIRAFRTNLLWGFAMLFFGPVSAAIFTIIHWKLAKKSFVVAVLGYIITSLALAKSGQFQLPLPPPDSLRSA